MYIYIHTYVDMYKGGFHLLVAQDCFGLAAFQHYLSRFHPFALENPDRLSHLMFVHILHITVKSNQVRLIFQY